MKRYLWTLVTIAGLAAGSMDTQGQDPAAAPTPPKRQHQALTEEQRQQLEQQVSQSWETLSLQEKQQVLRFHSALKEMPKEERNSIRERFERVLSMTPEQRQQMRENMERWRKMTPEERQKAREEYRKRKHEFEQQWRRDHPNQTPPPYPSYGSEPATPPAGQTPAPPSTPPPGT